jgi:hypothetical protein
MEVESNGTLPFLGAVVMKSGPKLAMKVSWKPTHAGCYLHFKSNHPHHVKRGVVHSLISRVKVIYQDQKGFNKEIKNIGHDVMLNEYPKEFVDSVMKPSKSSHPSSDTIYQGTILFHMLRVFMRNSDALETVSMSGPFSKLSAHFVGY